MLLFAVDGDGTLNEVIEGLVYLNKKDRQMRFNNGGDPIYAIFDKIDERPLSKIAKDFVKELKDDTIKFISTVLK